MEVEVNIKSNYPLKNFNTSILLDLYRESFLNFLWMSIWTQCKSSGGLGRKLTLISVNVKIKLVGSNNISQRDKYELLSYDFTK